MREIVLDTETTGLDPAKGHRIVEIACLELVNHLPTGRFFQCYVNPLREVDPVAEEVHGLGLEFLKDCPQFHQVVDGLLDFAGLDPLVIHNAKFDIGFLAVELERIGRPAIPIERAVDTVAIARQRFPGSPASLDALCRRFRIDNSSRTFHGALLDCELLGAVYIELLGGRQMGLDLAATPATPAAEPARRPRREPRPHAASPVELEAHARMLDGLITDPLWRQKNS